MKNFFFCLVTVSILVILSSCSKPSVIDEDKMIVIYTDLIIAHDTSAFAENDFTIVKQKVFGKHKITEVEYVETLEYYNAEPERWDQFFDKAIERLERLKAAKKDP